MNNIVTIRTVLKLKRLGLSIKKETDFYITPIRDCANEITHSAIYYKGVLVEDNLQIADLYEKLNLPTFEEMFCFLPKSIVINKCIHNLQIEAKGYTVVGYIDKRGYYMHSFVRVYNSNFAEALANLLIILSENEIITQDEVTNG